MAYDPRYLQNQINTLQQRRQRSAMDSLGRQQQDRLFARFGSQGEEDYFRRMWDDSDLEDYKAISSTGQRAKSGYGGDISAFAPRAAPPPASYKALQSEGMNPNLLKEQALEALRGQRIANDAGMAANPDSVENRILYNRNTGRQDALDSADVDRWKRGAQAAIDMEQEGTIARAETRRDPRVAMQEALDAERADRQSRIRYELPAGLRAQGQMGAAGIKGQADVEKAGVAADATKQASLQAALARIASMPAWTPEQVAARNQALAEMAAAYSQQQGARTPFQSLVPFGGKE